MREIGKKTLQGDYCKEVAKVNRIRARSAVNSIGMLERDVE